MCKDLLLPPLLLPPLLLLPPRPGFRTQKCSITKLHLQPFPFYFETAFTKLLTLASNLQSSSLSPEQLGLHVCPTIPNYKDAFNTLCVIVKRKTLEGGRERRTAEEERKEKERRSKASEKEKPH